MFAKFDNLRVFDAAKSAFVFTLFCFVMTGCDYGYPKIKVYNDALSPIEVCGDYYERRLIGDNPQDSAWSKKVRLNPGDSVNFYPWPWSDLENLKISVEFGEIEKKDSILFFDKNAMSALREDSVIRIRDR